MIWEYTWPITVTCIFILSLKVIIYHISSNNKNIQLKQKTFLSNTAFFRHCLWVKTAPLSIKVAVFTWWSIDSTIISCRCKKLPLQDFPLKTKIWANPCFGNQDMMFTCTKTKPILYVLICILGNHVLKLYK